MKKTYNNFAVGDYARYTGDKMVSSGILRKEAIGVIEKFETFNDKVRTLFKPLGSKQSMWVDFNNLRELRTEEKQLTALGFSLKNKMYHHPNHGIIISSLGLSTGPFFGAKGSSNVLTGLCLGDLTKLKALEDIEKYTVDGQFSLEQLYQDFPSVENMNRLAEELNIFGVKVDIQKLSQL